MSFPELRNQKQDYAHHQDNRQQKAEYHKQKRKNSCRRRDHDQLSVPGGKIQMVVPVFGLAVFTVRLISITCVFGMVNILS